jgi:hypothetical protein
MRRSIARGLTAPRGKRDAHSIALGRAAVSRERDKAASVPGLVDEVFSSTHAERL